MLAAGVAAGKTALTASSITLIPLSMRGIVRIAMSRGIISALSGTRLNNPSIEKGNTSLNPAAAHSAQLIHFGARIRRSASRAKHRAAITNAAVTLIFSTVTKRLLIATALPVFVNQTFDFLHFITSAVISASLGE
jgi:hypothetical protein